jgi:8-oxo-dGTP pyrophosphatase MutT (NUDIX family)
VPFYVAERRVGSVARAHLRALRAWPEVLRIGDSGVHLRAGADTRGDTLAQVNAVLRRQGLIRGWRDEPFALFDPQTLEPLATIERASARFWGTLTLGAHATGYVRGADGRPAALWIAQRSPTKPTDPGKYDNLIGGGVPLGQSPLDALHREGWEEAGLGPEQMKTARFASVLRLHRDIPEGLQHERLHAYDLELPGDASPDNQDGEVAGFESMPVADALHLAASESMTVDAAVVTLDFALRHGMLQPGSPLATAIEALRVRVQPI